MHYERQEQINLLWSVLPVNSQIMGGYEACERVAEMNQEEADGLQSPHTAPHLVSGGLWRRNY